MTLCIAWRSGERVSLASDSRVTLAADASADIGIKVLSLPVTVRGPTEKATGRTPVLYSHNWGMCFAGNFCAAHSVREFLCELMRNLQYQKLSLDFSIDTLCHIVLEAYKRTTTEVCIALAERGEFQMVVAGYCPGQKRVRAFRYIFEFQTGQRTKIPVFAEILTAKDDYYFFGTGSPQAEAAYEAATQTVKDTRFLAALKKIADDPVHDAVGGCLQYGTFESGDFVVYGMRETTTSPEGRLSARYVFGGQTIESEESRLILSDFVVTIPFKLPEYDVP